MWFDYTIDSGRMRWQRAAHEALGEFLTSATESGLPPLTWTIGSSCAFIGEVDSRMVTPPEQRAVFDAWVLLLGAETWPEHTDRDGTVRLHARFTWGAGDLVCGSIRAGLCPPVGEVGGESDV